MYVKTDIPFSSSIIEINNHKFIHLEIQIETKNVMNIIATYRPPATDITNFVDSLSELFRRCIKNETKSLFLGDINIDILKTNFDSQNYLNTLSEFDFVSTINKPTRLNSCLDHIFLKSEEHLHDQIIPLIMITQ